MAKTREQAISEAASIYAHWLTQSSEVVAEKSAA